MTDFQTIRRIIVTKSKDRATLLRGLVAIQRMKRVLGAINRPRRIVPTGQHTALRLSPGNTDCL
jgi:hypothetical protein